ncbi:MAG: Blue-light-activated protein [Syntrophus sp. PtaU1.Bin005]|nr:MAG: Blue-light-activated protein [Syntrophus sp. PtaU1.Bin005]
MFCRMVGYSADELLDRTPRMLFADVDEYESVNGKMNDMMAQDGLGMMETRARHKNGQLLDIYLNASYLDPQNPSAGMVVAILDITDRKRIERASRQMELQLNQAQKLDAIGQLAGGIAHDFNNILMGIQGNASMSMMEYQPGHPQYQRMSRIEEYVKRGANLTRQLLGFAREGKYELKTLSLNDLLWKSTRFFIETHKEIEAVFSLQEDLHPVEADAGQLEQVFLNLFINAGHAMPKGGRLHIQTANVTLQEADVAVFQVKPGDYAKISVSDTGMGMDAKTLEKIFEPFFTTKSEQGGTGLGLASSYGIIRNHGGIINAYSEPGHGATFHIYLPSSEKKVEKEEDSLQDKGLLRGTGGVLLIDDEPVILELGSELLTMLGYTVYRAENKEDALSIYQKNKDRIELIILDMILRGTSGSEVLKALRAVNPEVKVLLSSGYGLQGEVQKVMEMGCIGFIQKPYNFSDFSRIVHSALNPLKRPDAL